MKRIETKNLGRKKAVAPLILALIAIAIIIVLEGVIIANYLVRSENIVRAIREEEIIRGINLVEFAKRGLSQAVVFSFNQAAYDIGSRGGYFDLSSVSSFNCIPYWKVFSTTNIPQNFESQLKQNVLGIFNSYGKSLEVDVPRYDSIQFDKENNVMSLTATGKLTYEQQDFFTVKDSANFVQNADMKIFKMFDAAKEIENELDSKVSSAGSYSSALDAIVSVANSAGQKYSADGIEVTIQPGNNLGSGENNFALRILVVLKDNSGKKLVYDFDGKSLDMRNLQFRYYLLLGNSQITPQTNSCAKITY